MEEAGGHDHNIMMQTAKHTEKMEQRTVIKRGDMININELLFTKNRDYLIRFNDDRRVCISICITSVCMVSYWMSFPNYMAVHFLNIRIIINKSRCKLFSSFTLGHAFNNPNSYLSSFRSLKWFAMNFQFVCL